MVSILLSGGLEIRGQLLDQTVQPCKVSLEPLVLFVRQKDILVFSYLSMKTIEEPVNGRTVINVKMASDTETLGEVVVTAMGIKRQSETLTYSAQTV